MSVEILEIAQGNQLEVHISGKLDKAAYQTFVPAIEKQIQEHGKLRILVALKDFHGWDAGALWEDIKFEMKHFKDIERLAIVGEAKWEKGMATFCKPFTTAKIQYFDIAQLDEARRWLRE